MALKPFFNRNVNYFFPQDDTSLCFTTQVLQTEGTVTSVLQIYKKALTLTIVVKIPMDVTPMYQPQMEDCDTSNELHSTDRRVYGSCVL